MSPQSIDLAGSKHRRRRLRRGSTRRSSTSTAPRVPRRSSGLRCSGPPSPAQVIEAFEREPCDKRRCGRPSGIARSRTMPIPLAVVATDMGGHPQGGSVLSRGSAHGCAVRELQQSRGVLPGGPHRLEDARRRRASSIPCRPAPRLRSVPVVVIAVGLDGTGGGIGEEVSEEVAGPVPNTSSPRSVRSIETVQTRIKAETGPCRSSR